MSEYIKKEDAENIMLGSCDESALWKLRHLPSADVVEVVRCKDCKFWDSDCIWCNLWGNTQEYGNGFCSYGEDNDFCSQGEERRKK